MSLDFFQVKHNNELFPSAPANNTNNIVLNIHDIKTVLTESRVSTGAGIFRGAVTTFACLYMSLVNFKSFQKTLVALPTLRRMPKRKIQLIRHVSFP